MSDTKFKALVVNEVEKGIFHREIRERKIEDLPSGNVLVRVYYSSLNYKDALSASGNRGVTRKYPHTPGIDAAGIVEESQTSLFKPGDKVIVTSYDLGMNTSGGFSGFIRVPDSWVVPLPEKLSLRQSMMFGTAGFTAALSVYKLINSGINPESGEILVTGATGGVGSIAVSILNQEGFSVCAVNGFSDESDYLLSLGAKSVISIEEASAGNAPLLKERWAGCIDTVGGNILASAVKSTKQNGAVTCCGNAASHELPLNVYPFILRGITLIGIDSQQCPMPLRKKVWDAIAEKWNNTQINEFVSEIPLELLSEKIDLMLSGRNRGRTIVNINQDLI
ncbi:MAG: YhdH/YhfP family quinone oxidoreductase [Desulfobacteraceae bacterium]|nr:YhdH/YhfP family quinone oxidoreductase [Desulfobacteraceae bacterium]MCB9494086.1 YhdH/YhfP family quinone oxidoreductase [Desulfobacteraceae bacterium]